MGRSFEKLQTRDAVPSAQASQDLITHDMVRMASILGLCKATAHGCCARQHPVCAVQALSEVERRALPQGVEGF